MPIGIFSIGNDEVLHFLLHVFVFHDGVGPELHAVQKTVKLGVIIGQPIRIGAVVEQVVVGPRRIGETDAGGGALAFHAQVHQPVLHAGDVEGGFHLLHVRLIVLAAVVDVQHVGMPLRATDSGGDIDAGLGTHPAIEHPKRVVGLCEIVVIMKIGSAPIAMIGGDERKRVLDIFRNIRQHHHGIVDALIKALVACREAERPRQAETVGHGFICNDTLENDGIRQILCGIHVNRLFATCQEAAKKEPCRKREKFHHTYILFHTK